MTPVDLLCQLLLDGGTFKPYDYDQSLIDILYQNKCFFYNGIDPYITCEECDIGHDLTIHTKPDGTKHGYCPEVGFVPFDDRNPEYALAKVNIEHIINEIGEVLKVDQNKKPIPPFDNIKPIGFFKFGKLNVFGMIVYELETTQQHQEINDFYLKDIKRIKHTIEAVFIFVLHNKQLPELKYDTHFIIPLQKIVSINNKGFSISPTQINMFLPKDKKQAFNDKKSKGGRKNTHSAIRIVAQDLLNKGHSWKEIKKDRYHLVTTTYEKAYNKTTSYKSCQRAFENWDKTQGTE